MAINYQMGLFNGGSVRVLNINRLRPSFILCVSLGMGCSEVQWRVFEISLVIRIIQYCKDIVRTLRKLESSSVKEEK